MLLELFVLSTFALASSQPVLTPEAAGGFAPVFQPATLGTTTRHRSASSKRLDPQPENRAWPVSDQCVLSLTQNAVPLKVTLLLFLA